MSIDIIGQSTQKKRNCDKVYVNKFNSRCEDDCKILITTYTNYKDDSERTMILHTSSCQVGLAEYEEGLEEWQKNNGFQIVKPKTCTCGGSTANTTHARYCDIYKGMK